MITRRAVLFLAVLVLSCASALPQIPSDAEIHKILVDRVGSENLGIGIVVGVIDSNGRRVIAYGSLAKNDNRRLDGDTVFEIGSMTKVFTSLVLMDMAGRGEVTLNDPISKYLPSSVKVPERNGRHITFADLSTQSSGLPRLPANMHPKDPNNPYADYSVQHMYDFLSGYQLTRDIGSQYEYSNLAVGLLGHVLSLRAGMSYEALVRARISDPLGMADTRITLTPEMKARLASGHNEALAPVENWDLPTLAGAGALRSTANDILTFLAANLGFIKTPLAQDMADETSIRRPTPIPDTEIAYAWHIQTKDGKSIIWHNGGTGGYRTFMGFDPQARVGVVALANVSTPAGVDDIALHLLNPSNALLKIAPPTQHKEITLDPKLFDRYVGVYQLEPSALLTVSRDGGMFYTQLTGQPRVQVFAESDRKFFLKVVDAQLTFEVDQNNPQSATASVTLHQNGRDTVAKRITETEAKQVTDSIQARNAEIAKRYKDQTATPASEAAVRAAIEGLQSGQPDYGRMSPTLAAATREQLPQIQAMIVKLGALHSVSFKGVGQGGADIYQLQFENGSLEYRIVLGPGGTIEGAFLRPAN